MGNICPKQEEENSFEKDVERLLFKVADQVCKSEKNFTSYRGCIKEITTEEDKKTNEIVDGILAEKQRGKLRFI